MKSKSLITLAIISLAGLRAHAADVTWDTAATAGIQGGAGTWDTSATNWTTDGGANRLAWDNTLNSADTPLFGVSGGSVTVSGTINLAGIKSAGNINSYNLTGGTLNFGSSQGSIDTTSLTTSGSNLFTINNALTGTGGLTIAASGNLSANGGSSGTRLDLKGDNTGLSGGITITAGLVSPGSQSALGSNTITLSNGGGLLLTAGSLSLNNNLTFSTGGGTLRTYGGTTFTFTGSFTGSGALSKTDGGTLVITGANTGYSGAITIGGGTLRVGDGGTSGGLGSGAVINNSTLRTNRADAFTLANDISGTGTILSDGTGTTNLTGVVTSTGVIGVANGGAMVINNASTNVGTTSLSGADTNITGSLQVLAGNVNTRILNFNSGTSSISGGSITTVNQVRIGNTASPATAILNQTGGSVTVNNSATYLADQSGIGTHNLSGGTYTQAGGTTYLIATRGTGTLNLSGTGQLNTTVLWFGHGSASSGSTSGSVNLDGGTLQVARIEKPGAIGTSVFNFNGGLLRATADNAYFLAGNSGSTAFAGITRANVRNDGAKIDTNGFNIGIGQALAHSNIGGDNATDGGLVKKGAGTLTLSTSNTYTGPTVVDQGTLKLTGGGSISQSSSITLKASTTLDVSNVTSGWTLGSTQSLSGTGTVGGNATIQGALNPGLSAGTLTFSNDLVLASTSLLGFELDALDTTVGSGFNDLITVAGAFTLDGTLNVSPLSSFNGITSGTWTLFTYGSSFTDNGLALGSMPTLDSGYSWQLGSGSGNVTLSIVPEPAAALLGGMGMLVLLRRRPRRGGV